MEDFIRYSSILIAVVVFACFVRAEDGCDDLRATYGQISNSSQQIDRTTVFVNATSPNCTTCLTLQGVLEQGGASNLTIYLGAGTVQLSSTLNITGKSGIAIIGSSSKQTTIVSCEPMSPTTGYVSTNVLVYGSYGIYFANITFDGCGLNTSSVVLQDSDQVVFDSCIFTNTMASAVFVNNSMSVLIVSSSFSNNQQAFDCLSSKPLRLLVLNSLFEGTSNSVQPRNLFGGRGGAMQIDVESSSNNPSKICIVGSNFTANSAPTDGGAVYLSLVNGTNGTEVYIRDSTFFNNSCGRSGGAVYVTISASFNAINISGTTFSRNSASVGGAVSIVGAVGQLYQAVHIVRCLFDRNGGYNDGTALGVFSLTGANEPGLSIVVDDSNFTFNYQRPPGASSAAIILSQSLLTFGGAINISCNTGGGVALYGSRMDVTGTVVFYNNLALLGAGAYMTGKSLILLYGGSALTFSNNTALQEGGALYVKTTTSDSLFPVKNKNCFIQFYSNNDDIPPSQWETSVTFLNNQARVMGAAIYASDFTQCAWFGNDAISTSKYIFNASNGSASPFILSNNRIVPSSNMASEAFASDAKYLYVSIPALRLPNQNLNVANDETVTVVLHASDQFYNKRQAIWIAQLPGNETLLGAVSAAGSSFTYTVPSIAQLSPSNISIGVSLNGIKNSSTDVILEHITTCHPGYGYSGNNTSVCQCKTDQKVVLRCDDDNRYIYVKAGLWVNYTSNNTLIYGRTIPWYLNCSNPLGNLPGCLFRFDDVDSQCGPNRKGVLCSECKDGFGITLDLQSCKDNCGVVGPGLYIYIILYCTLVPILTLVILYCDVKVPNELKGFIFYAQVIGFIYRDSDRQKTISAVLSVLYNILGFTTAFPFCLFEGMSPLLVAFLGIVPYILAVIAMVMYLFCAKYKTISMRYHYGYHGFYFIFLFMYKYFLDFGFILTSCRDVQKIGWTHIYTGKSCFNLPFVIYYCVGVLIIAVFAIGVPVYVLYLMYRHKRVIQLSNAISFGLKEGDKYAWYGVWDIWRRIPFVALTSVTTEANTTLFVYAVLILAIMIIISIVKPYKGEHVNVIELLITLCLFAVTISELDDTDVYVTYQVGRVFALVPYFYVLLYIIWKLFTYIGVCRFCREKVHMDEETSKKRPSISYSAQDKDDQEYHLYDTADGKEAEDSIKPREPLLESYYQINQKSCNRRCAVTEQAESEL